MSFSPDLLPPENGDSAWRYCFHEDRLLLDELSGGIPILDDAALRAIGASESVFVGTMLGRPAYATDIEAAAEPAGLHGQSMRAYLARADDTHFACASRAYQLVRWNREHRHCGSCGTATVQRGNERARECPACQLAVYPRITPAIMALVVRGREILLARSTRFPTGMFSALAGFVEAGESLEDTLQREVREEVGVEVANMRYFGSQSWPFPNSLMLAFACDYAGGELVAQEAEIAEAGWFDVAALPMIPPSFSIAGRLIRHVVAEAGAAPPR